MNWTKQPPTKAGWYWWRPVGIYAPQLASMVHVDDSEGVLEAVGLFHDDYCSLAHWKGNEWYGPLEVPQ